MKGLVNKVSDCQVSVCEMLILRIYLAHIYVIIWGRCLRTPPPPRTHVHIKGQHSPYGCPHSQQPSLDTESLWTGSQRLQFVVYLTNNPLRKQNHCKCASQPSLKTEMLLCSIVRKACLLER